MGLGVLLVFFGVARVATRLIPSLSVFMSPIARWSVFVLAVVVWPFFTLPYWLLRYGVWGPGAAWKRVLAFLGGALNRLRPRDRADHGDPEGGYPLGAGVAGRVPRRHPGSLDLAVGKENARRNPQRTASTAAALMIGLALMTLVATLAAGIIASFRAP